MNDQEWQELDLGLRAVSHVERRVAAAEKLLQTATVEDVPKLMRLLADEDSFVREAAAWPIAELKGPSALPELLRAYQRGFEQGHDNDGFTTALVELVQTSTADAEEVLHTLVKDPDPGTRRNAEWLLEFVAGR